MNISIVIPSYGRAAILSQTLKHAMVAINSMDAEIILINDGPKYESEIIPQGIKVYDNEGGGVSKARNLGFRKSKGRIVVFMDNDVIIDNKVLNSICDTLSEKKNWLMNPDWVYPNSLINSMRDHQFGRFILQTNNINYKSWAPYLDWQANKLIRANKLGTFFLAMRREVFELVGGFNENIFFGEEDFEFTMRAAERGFELIVDCGCLVFHNEADRVTLKNKMKRMKILGMILGQNGQLHYTGFKKLILKLGLKFKSILFALVESIPNIKYFDPVYNLLVHRLISLAIYEGYLRKNERKGVEKIYSSLD